MIEVVGVPALKLMMFLLFVLYCCFVVVVGDVVFVAEDLGECSDGYEPQDAASDTTSLSIIHLAQRFLFS